MKIDKQSSNKQDNSNKQKVSIYGSLFVGSVAGALEAFINQPLWAIKTRQQYGDKFTLDPRILYRGAIANTASMAFIISLRVLVRDAVNTIFFQTTNPTIPQSVVSAFSGGVVTSCITSSIELGMTQLQKEKKTNAGLSSTVYLELLKLINKHGHLRAFTGMPCTAMRDGWFCIGFLSMTPIFKQYIKLNNYVKNDLPASVVAGILSGSLAAFISHPFDTIKTVQQANANNNSINSVISTANAIIKKDGWQGMYRGFFWRAARVSSGVTILGYTTDILSKKLSKNLFT